MSFPLSPSSRFLEEFESVVMVDTSDYKNLNLVPVLLHFVTPEKRVQTKVTEFHNLKSKTADALMT
jgi:hypothetical protein